MGELDSKPFLEAMKKKFSKGDTAIRALELCSLWQENLKDPSWYPFKVINVKGEDKVCFLFFYLSLFLLFTLLYINFDAIYFAYT